MITQGADTAFVVTEWDEICALTPGDFKANLKEPVVFDGRNCFNIETMKEAGLNYYSVGRPVVKTEKELV